MTDAKKLTSEENLVDSLQYAIKCANRLHLLFSPELMKAGDALKSRIEIEQKLEVMRMSINRAIESYEAFAASAYIVSNATGEIFYLRRIE